MDTVGIDRRWVGDVNGAFAGVGAGDDVDVAFDDAVDAACYDVGHAGAVASPADVDASSLLVTGGVPVSLAVALRTARAALLVGVAPGVVHAVALCAPSTHRRRRPVLRIIDPTFEVGNVVGPVFDVSEGFADRIRAELVVAEAGLNSNELVEAVELRSVTQRFKVITTPERGKSEREFQVFDDTRHVVSFGHATASLARRAAIDLAKAGAVGGKDVFGLEVRAVVGRAGGRPLVAVRRERVAQRVSLRVTVAAAKDQARVKVTGWLFYGVVAAVPLDVAVSSAPDTPTI